MIGQIIAIATARSIAHHESGKKIAKEVVKKMEKEAKKKR